MKRTNKLMLGMTAALALGLSVGIGTANLASAETASPAQSVVTDRGTVYEYQTGTMSVVQNALGGTIFSDFDAVNINALADARRYCLLAPQYTWATGGVKLTGMDDAATDKYLVLTLQNALCDVETVNVLVNDVAMSSSVYYVDSQFADMAAQTEATSLTLPKYTNSKVSKAVIGFCGEVVIPMSAFSGVTEINSVTVSMTIDRTNLNVGEVYVADFNTDTLALSNKTSIWTPGESNWERVTGALDKQDNTYTSENIFSLTKLEAGQFVYTASYALSSLDTAARNQFFWQFPEEMIDPDDGLVHLDELGIKGLAFDLEVPEGTPGLQIAIRLSSADNTGLDYDTAKGVWQTSNSKAAQKRILSTGLVKGGNTSYMPGGAFDGTIYIPFTTSGLTGTASNPTVVQPVIWVDYNNSSELTNRQSLKYSNVRFITDETPYETNQITLVSANGVLEGKIGDVAIESNANNKVLAGTTANFKVTPTLGYKVSSVVVTPEDGEAETITLDENNEFSYVVNSPISVMATYEIANYNVTYVLDGGENSEENPETYTFLRGFELAAPTKKNAEFLGWYTTADFSGEAITEIEDGTTGDITLYAKWQKTGGCNASIVGISGAAALLGACAVVLLKKGRKE